jgi:sulfate permease, SulP family
LGGFLAFGVLPGLLIAAGVSLILLMQRLGRPGVGTWVRNPITGAWVRADRHPDGRGIPGFVVARVDSPIFYANVEIVRHGLLAEVEAPSPPPHALVVDLAGSDDLDLTTLDALKDLAGT